MTKNLIRIEERKKEVGNIMDELQNSNEANMHHCEHFLWLLEATAQEKVVLERNNAVMEVQLTKLS